jgi:multisubunit Na+/H+ antiporter MnhE subunit
MARSTHIVVATVARAAALFVVWLVIDDNVSEPELLTGVGVALLATVIVTIVGRVRTGHARMPLSMLRYAYRPLVLLVADTVRVSWVLTKSVVLRRPVNSRFRAVRYRGASLAPNRYVIGVDTDAELLLVHQLGESGSPLDPLELG